MVAEFMSFLNNVIKTVSKVGYNCQTENIQKEQYYLLSGLPRHTHPQIFLNSNEGVVTTAVCTSNPYSKIKSLTSEVPYCNKVNQRILIQKQSIDILFKTTTFKPEPKVFMHNNMYTKIFNLLIEEPEKEYNTIWLDKQVLDPKLTDFFELRVDFLKEELARLSENNLVSEKARLDYFDGKLCIIDVTKGKDLYNLEFIKTFYECFLDYESHKDKELFINSFTSVFQGNQFVSPKAIEELTKRVMSDDFFDSSPRNINSIYFKTDLIEKKDIIKNNHFVSIKSGHYDNNLPGSSE